MSCHGWLTKWAGEAERPALVYVDSIGDVQTSSWRQLVGDVAGLLSAIDKSGFLPGDCLAHSFGNTRAGVLVALASLIAGTIEVPSQDADIGRYFDPDAIDLAAPLDYSHFSRFANREQPFAPDHPALVLFTSGSTGEPRGVTLSRQNLFSNARAKLLAAPQFTSDVRITVLPICHAYARTCDLMTWLLSGCTLAITQGWDGWQQLAPTVRPTLVNTVPSFASRLIDQSGSHDLGGIRMLGCGGAALSTASFAWFHEQSITVIQGYGLTEASPVVCSATPLNSRPSFVGCPVDGCQTRVHGDGQLEVRGIGVMLGYWNDVAATNASIRDGWLQTGDCVEIDPLDGQFRILGRTDDRITMSNGRKFFPGPIEQRIVALPGILHAMLTARDRHIELLIDVDARLCNLDTSLAEIEKAIRDVPAWQRPRSIRVSPRPFADIPNAITAKGNLRRQAIIAKAAHE